MDQPEPPKKKLLSDKKIDSLNKARTALTKSRDAKRKAMHESAVDEIVERKLAEKLSKLQPPTPPPLEKQEEESEEDTHEIIEIVRKPKPKKKIIVVPNTSSEEEEVVAPKKKTVDPPPPTKSAPKKKPPPKQRPVAVEADPRAARQQLVYQELYKNIFGR